LADHGRQVIDGVSTPLALDPHFVQPSAGKLAAAKPNVATRCVQEKTFFQPDSARAVRALGRRTLKAARAVA
jgi:hypothetical protein